MARGTPRLLQYKWCIGDATHEETNAASAHHAIPERARLTTVDGSNGCKAEESGWVRFLIWPPFFGVPINPTIVT